MQPIKLKPGVLCFDYSSGRGYQEFLKITQNKRKDFWYFSLYDLKSNEEFFMDISSNILSTYLREVITATNLMPIKCPESYPDWFYKFA